MHRPTGGRLRTALAGAAAFALALLAAGPAHAATGTPTTPTELFNAYQSCSTDPNAPLYLAGRGGITLEGIGDDSDPSVSGLTVQFRVWPVTDPTRITTAADTWAVPGNEAAVNVSAFGDGQTYAWQAQTVDQNGATSDWSTACYITDDDTAPTQAPTVTSSNYPQWQPSQSGAPIHLSLGANGVGDVAGYEYTWSGDFSVPGATIGAHGIPTWEDPYSDPRYAVRASSLGGSATVDLVPPSGGGLYRLTVASLDRALNQSPTVDYWIWIKPNAPQVVKLSNNPVYGKQASFKLTADPGLQAASPVTSFTITDLSSPSQSKATVKADANGTAEYSLPLDGQYGDVLQVSTTSADGWISEQQWWSDGYTDTTPTVTSTVYPEDGSGGGAGVAGTFTFAPKVKGVASYTYTVNDGPATTVKADGPNPAQISWTPPASGWYMLTVNATTQDGVALAPYYYMFTVN
ncbi:hypothetical protein [Streptacidiphilus anmyonensis]|uniref:hypothetical protein n=1 Tax=Streptacidiphilus anmyonensis TaxID=405782 RepID=UPI0005A8BF2A|nr:hypothetical protein [Streptacidiphilus anmyonensis]